MSFSELDREMMELALAEARLAAEADEVPVGAVLYARGAIVGRGHNRRETGRDATLHAEMIAIREACATMGGWRLPDSTLYVTLEPCPMCAGALVQARVERLVFATTDPKGGCCGTVMNIADHPGFNHRVQIESGLLAEEAAALLKAFFAKKRAK